ncbi:MAG: S8 family serine peptidase [Candidatus Eisenbacteria bacterium]|uniref:S8 family serine peptidase n=1 Tax=Eiseniibacteriota bacterium TaxID=2212470 RepID=A0A948RW72_UNCEI|nr:S8 family serine peptidase [Candidatus Eisenbacteria bacterium]MBU2692148.1 S8 family serine peptidase [Candidatus Eisenbacteria bacterium]
MALHERGSTGDGVVIGILDTGFQRSHAAFNDPAHTLSVIAERDFVDNDPHTGIETGDPPDQHSHGTLILGTIGAYREGELIGGAYDASFILAKVEDAGSEFPLEEDWFAAGLEFIEAQGGDVATSSLIAGWYGQNEMDGETSIMAQAFNIATANGVHCCQGAGNSGHDDLPTTSHLAAPADACIVQSHPE